MQLVQLQQAMSRFEALGYRVAALSYDSPALLEEFSARKGVSYPLLSDADSHWLKRAGLLNQEATGMLEGVSLPATIVVSPDLKVSHIFRESAYQDRITPASLLSILQGGQAPESAQTALPEKTVVKTTQTDQQVTAGSLFSIAVEVALPQGYHIYAPGADGPIPISLTFEPHPFLEVEGVDFPPSRTETLLGDTVPVYEGRTVITARLKLRSEKELRATLPQLSTKPLTATLEYQCCTDKICLAPESRALRWTFDFLPLDLDRSPEALQHKE